MVEQKFVKDKCDKKEKFLLEFNRIKTSIESGTTPVYSELRVAKQSLKELVPYLCIQSIFLVLSTSVVQKIEVNEVLSVVILLVANTTSQTVSSIVLVMLKHILRVRKLKKHNLEVNERNIAVLESMEYQSV